MRDRSLSHAARHEHAKEKDRADDEDDRVVDQNGGPIGIFLERQPGHHDEQHPNEDNNEKTDKQADQQFGIEWRLLFVFVPFFHKVTRDGIQPQCILVF